MVASPGKDIVFSFGGWNTQKDIFKFTCSNKRIQSCRWKEMETKLTYSRAFAVAMVIPYDLANKLC